MAGPARLLDDPRIEIVGDRAGRHHQLAVGGGADRGQDRGQHHPRHHPRRQLDRRKDQAGLSRVDGLVGELLGKRFGPPRARLGQGPGHESHGDRPPVDPDRPDRGDDSADTDRPRVAQGHEPHQHVGLSGIAEVDAQSARTQEKPQERRPRMFGPEAHEAAAGDLAELGADEGVAAVAQEQVRREQHQRADHDDPLHEIGPARRAESAHHRVGQDDSRPDEHPEGIVDRVEARLEGLPRRAELRCHVEEHRDQDHDHAHDAKQRPPLAEVKRQEVGQGERAGLGRAGPQPVGHHEPVEEKAEQAPGDDPVGGDPAGEGPADEAQRHPPRLARRRRAQRRDPGPQRSAGEKVVFIRPLAEPGRVHTDRDDQERVEGEGEDKEHGGRRD